MLFRIIWKIVGTFLLGFSFTLFLPLCVAVYYEYIILIPPQPLAEPSTFPFIYTFLISLLVALAFFWMGRQAKGIELYRKEGLASVVLIWFIIPVIAALPFLFARTVEKPLHAYFEAVSGLTTTGATVFVAKKYDARTQIEVPYIDTVCGERDTHYRFFGTIKPIRTLDGTIIAEGIEAVGLPLLLWRSFIQWLGGLGIIVLFIAVLPALGVGGKILFQAEVPGPLKETLTPRLKETAAVLWKIYLGLTVIQIFLLKFTNEHMTWIDASSITFSTLSTGGFTPRNGSIASYQSTVTEWIVIAFMILGSLNFSLYFYWLRGKFYHLFDRELIVYLIVIIIAGIFAASNLVGTEKVPLKVPLIGQTSVLFDWADAIRTGFFQTISAQTSTGFATANYDQWPYVIQVLMLILIYWGGMSGSTSGGIKMMRHIIVFRTVQDKVELMFRPEAMRSVKIGQRRVDKDVAMTVLCFLVTLVTFAILGTFLLCFDGLDPETALSVITSSINNSGMGWRESGPADSFAFLSDFGLILTSIWMILGRLEFFAILVILVPTFWQER